MFNKILKSLLIILIVAIPAISLISCFSEDKLSEENLYIEKQKCVEDCMRAYHKYCERKDQTTPKQCIELKNACQSE